MTTRATVTLMLRIVAIVFLAIALFVVIAVTAPDPKVRPALELIAALAFVASFL